MSTPPTFLIVGASLAGASAARELRKQGFGGRVVMAGSEPHEPYARPPLSKGLLLGSEELESIWVRPSPWYPEQAVELKLDSTVASIDPGSHSVQLDSGESISYNKLLLATGSRPRRLDLPGFDHRDVHYLRTLDDALALKELLAGGGHRLVIVGSGWIGMELAAAARQMGNDVTILDRNAIPLSAVLGDSLGNRFAELHRSHGVHLLNSVTVEEVVVDNDRIVGIRHNGDGLVVADIVVVGAGAIPNIELASAAGISVDNGVVVDEFLRTSDPDVYAAGDIANAWHPVIWQRLRSEHWMNAMHSGRAAARSMMGMKTPYDDIPYFYTDQFELSMEYSGYGPLARDADVVIRGDVDKLEFVAFWVRDAKVVAGMNVNVWDVNKQVQDLIRSGRTVSPDQLADADIPLDRLIGPMG